LEDIINLCIDIGRKYLGNQKFIPARKKRTVLFEGENFKNKMTGMECIISNFVYMFWIN
jgi:hypothetical protein